jgi:hypothetical protein
MKQYYYPFSVRTSIAIQWAGNACLQILVLCCQITYLTKFNNLRKENFKNYDPLPWQSYLLKLGPGEDILQDKIFCFSK